MQTVAAGRWSAAEQDEIWTRRRRGESLLAINRYFGTYLHAVRRFLIASRGCPTSSGAS